MGVIFFSDFFIVTICLSLNKFFLVGVVDVSDELTWKYVTKYAFNIFVLRPVISSFIHDLYIY